EVPPRSSCEWNRGPRPAVSCHRKRECLVNQGLRPAPPYAFLLRSIAPFRSDRANGSDNSCPHTQPTVRYRRSFALTQPTPSPEKQTTSKASLRLPEIATQLRHNLN